ncbi:hypothetical protein AB205_0219470 [Aquarana catesbeiana]|uniref:Uncharacterized protein n=1 Tax=Aquarana catesbeiana TaxID=8400 RepID=A0A2G9PPM5_AQUCT|nr:hypothetical protein AB205_0219470 [Aquarana catesbeiana]
MYIPALPVLHFNPCSVLGMLHFTTGLLFYNF